MPIAQQIAQAEADGNQLQPPTYVNELHTVAPDDAPLLSKVGDRIGYSLATGVVVALVCITGLVGTFLAIFPMQALVPALLTSAW